MKDVKLVDISKYRNNEPIFDDLSLEIPSGKFTALLGPSGCGKTTLLRIIAGLENPDKGQVFLGGKNITKVPVNQRKINTVFQSYALFPNLNVFENVAYSLRLKKLPEMEIKRRVRKFLEIVNLERHSNKSIQQLSGGQQQRVALARALINEPDVLLLDEPLAALDQQLREKMLMELIDLQEELGMTFVYVTHDQGEALTVADQMMIMNYDGEIEQIGTPKEVYEYPKSAFVAKFVGQTNLINGFLDPKKSKVKVKDLGNFDVRLNGFKDEKEGTNVIINLRPEKIMISKDKLKGFDNHLEGFVDSVIYHGRSTQYFVRLKNNMKLQ